MVDPEQVRREVAAIESEQAARLAEGAMMVDLKWRRVWLGVAVAALLGGAWMG